MISVVIPLYNKEQSITATLQSVLAQTYTDDYLHRQGLVPVYIDGMKNYNEPIVFHRELL